jgi:dextranase
MYVEVWPPHTTLGHLADVATRARAAGGGKPVVIAAYQHVYDQAPADEADRATAFTMATLFSHGATQLLAGEGDRILVDPYYVRNHVVEHSTAQLLLRWYDFAVEHTELLFDDALVDMTGALAGPYNGDLDVAYPAVSLSESAAAGTVWRRVVGHGGRLVVHLVNLTDQSDTEWDAPRKPVQPVAGGQLRVRRVGDAVPRVRVADPDAIAALRDLPVVVDGEHAVCDLPPLHVWQLLSIELVPAADHVEESR